MEIILADPPSSIPRTPNLGILYLISSLRQKFADIEILYLETFLSLKEQLAKIDIFNPDIYGISFASFLAPTAYHTINAAKERFPNLPIICGSPHPRADPEGVLKKTGADICVIGEGEETIVELVRHL